MQCKPTTCYRHRYGVLFCVEQVTVILVLVVEQINVRLNGSNLVAENETAFLEERAHPTLELVWSGGQGIYYFVFVNAPYIPSSLPGESGMGAKNPFRSGVRRAGWGGIRRDTPAGISARPSHSIPCASHPCLILRVRRGHGVPG